MAIIFPGTLPTFLRGNYSETPQETKITSGNDTGRPKTRERFTDACQYISGKIQVTTAQRATFKTFYHSDTANGALEFTFPHPVDGDITVIFDGAYTINDAGNGLWDIAFKLLRLP